MHSCRANDVLHLCSCCREIVNAIVRKKRSEMDSEADFELEELNKIKVKGCLCFQLSRSGVDETAFAL